MLVFHSGENYSKMLVARKAKFCQYLFSQTKEMEYSQARKYHYINATHRLALHSISAAKPETRTDGA